MKGSDDRSTPPELFAALHERFQFTLDAAASDVNALLPRHNTEAEPDKFSWHGERVFCNPPFSDIRPWVERAWDDRARLVVMLVPANRTDQPWWQDLIEPRRDRGWGLDVEFIRGRTRFFKGGVRMGAPNFACCLLIWIR